MLHRTVNSSDQSTFNFFNRGSKPYGTYFVVDKDGKIYQTANLNKLTIHAGNANPYSVSIEVAGLSYDKNGKQTWVDVDHWEDVTDKQARSVACLLVALMKKYNFTYEKVHFHEDLCNKQRYEGRLVWIAMKKYLPNPPSGNKPTPYRNSKLILDPRFPEG
ncbi:N-acetylmuramoyl-L-alanine amidase [Psychrobacter okhotskensis]|uniref:peptidoglycan recognition protein family protein n=1 Tax=Psychrobacter okhotskensis TaxID=212403 RepID=UPI002233F3C2|nr:peptidoglycan recognition family protein [Psychrobacter okhotskensis]